MCEKLPDWLRQRWNRLSYESKLRERRFPDFNCFVSFMVKEEGIANAPLGRQSSDKTKPEITPAAKGKSGRSLATKKAENSTKQSANSNTASSHTTTSTASSVPQVSAPETQQTQQTSQSDDNTSSFATTSGSRPNQSNRPPPTPHCYFCEQNHWTSSCESLVAAPLEKRKEFLRKPFRCIACLSTKHKVSECRYPKTCATCQEKHHTAFHDVSFFCAASICARNTTNDTNITIR